MRVYINRTPVGGPWGGGNRFVTALVERLRRDRHDVVFGLGGSRVDVYVVLDPRFNSSGVEGRHVVDECRRRGGRLLFRVGDVGGHGKPELYEAWRILVNMCPDVPRTVVFPSGWAREQLQTPMYAEGLRVEVVHNGAHQAFHDVWQPPRRPGTLTGRPLKVITHHWSDNVAKGFDVYRHVDELPGVEFTYIGRAPADVAFKRHVQPQDVPGLTRLLPNFDVYLTASCWEAGANHVLEAMACGLPVVWSKDGGSIREYCQGYGIQFDLDDMTTEDVVMGALARCASWEVVGRRRYTRTLDHVVDDYMRLIVG